MSNILVIKHGALGDIVQISGALKDIRRAHSKDRVFILTSSAYKGIFEQCPFVDDVIVDNRNSFVDFRYLLGLRNKIKNLNFKKVYDLQNSSRTDLYRKYIFRIKDWCSSRTILKDGEEKKEFDKGGVLDRFKIQLSRANIKADFTSAPDFSWAVDSAFELDRRIKKDYIYIAPFASAGGEKKIWPYFIGLIKKLKQGFPNVDIVLTPGPNEIEEAKNLGVIVQLDGGKATDIRKMAAVIKGAKFVISNDTGPAHIAAHLGCKGLVLFGSHTTPKKTSIETKNFKAVSIGDLYDLKVDTVYEKVKRALQERSIL